MFDFFWPWCALLLPLPLIIRRLFPQFKKNEGMAQLHFPAIDRLRCAFAAASKKTSSPLFLCLLFLAWTFVVVALMRPERVDQFRLEKNKGYDLMLAVDISASMQAVDFSTPTKVISRLDAAKEVVGKFALKRQGDRVGLILFGEKAYLHAPLTLDTLAVSQMLNNTLAGMAGNATAIGDAIGLSVKALRHRPQGSRALLLLTDGEDNASSIPPLEAAKLAKQYGIRIYTIGLGRDGLAPVPTGKGGYAMAKISIDEGLLKKIASMTGGQYFLAQDKKTLENIYATIDTLEKTESNETLFLARDPLYHYPLALAMSLLALSFFYQLIASRKIDYGT